MDEDASFNSTVDVSGATNLHGSLTVGGGTSLDNTLTVDGDASFNSAVWVTNNVNALSFTSKQINIMNNMIIRDGGKLISFSDCPIQTSGKLSAGELEVTSATTLNTLTVESDASFNNTVDVSGSTKLHSTLEVTDATTLNNTLTVDSDASFNSTVDVSGATNLHASLTVDGATSLGNTLTVDEDASFNSTVDVSGATKLHSTLEVEGATSLENTLTVEQDASFNSTVDVSGSTKLHSTLEVEGATNLENTLTVESDASFNSTVDVSGATKLHSSLEVEGATSLENTLTVEQDASFNSTVDVSGATKLHSTLEVTDATTLNNTLTVDSDASFNSTVDVSGATNLHGSLTVDGDVSLNSTLDVLGATTIYSLLDVDRRDEAHEQNIATFQGPVGDINIYSGYKINMTKVGTNIISATSGAGELEFRTGDIRAVLIDRNQAVDVSGSTKLHSTLTVDEDASFNSTVDVSGATKLHSTLDVTGDTSVSTFDSTGATSLATGGGDVNIASSGAMTTVKGALTVDEDASFNSAVDVSKLTIHTELCFRGKGSEFNKLSRFFISLSDAEESLNSGDYTPDANVNNFVLVAGEGIMYYSPTLDSFVDIKEFTLAGAHANAYIKLDGNEDNYIQFSNMGDASDVMDLTKNWSIGISLYGLTGQNDSDPPFHSGGVTSLFSRGGVHINLLTSTDSNVTNWGLFVTSDNDLYSSDKRNSQTNTNAKPESFSRILFTYQYKTDGTGTLKYHIGSISNSLQVTVTSYFSENMINNQNIDNTFSIGKAWVADGVYEGPGSKGWNGGFNNLIMSDITFNSSQVTEFYTSTSEDFVNNGNNVVAYAKLGEDVAPNVIDQKGNLTGGELYHPGSSVASDYFIAIT